tara:strand:+ start:985 stop:1311 length:327 start_codon:yes stop_codon:yes gene_type:complete
MKKKTAFKLRSGNKPDVEKMTGASPVKYEYFYEQPGYKKYDKYKDNPYRSSYSGYSPGSSSSMVDFMNAAMYDNTRRRMDIMKRDLGGRAQSKQLRAQRKNKLRSFDT